MRLFLTVLACLCFAAYTLSLGICSNRTAEKISDDDESDTPDAANVVADINEYLYNVTALKMPVEVMRCVSSALRDESDTNGYMWDIKGEVVATR